MNPTISMVKAMLDLIREDYQQYDRKLSHQGLWVMAVYRYGRWVNDVQPIIVRKFLTLIYRCLKLVSQVLTGVDLPCEAIVGRRFKIEHVGGIVVGAGVIFGDDVVIRQGVTVESRRTGDRGVPVIGNGVDIGAGAKILGPIEIGDNVMIGANAVVIGDVPANSVAVGIPARVRARSKSVEQIVTVSLDYSPPLRAVRSGL
jgi:serine O-acetyltransferase